MSKSRQRLTYGFALGQDRIVVTITEAKFGWTVVRRRNGVEESRETAMGSLMTVLAEATS
jgi:hypothetical protein